MKGSVVTTVTVGLAAAVMLTLVRPSVARGDMDERLGWGLTIDKLDPQASGGHVKITWSIVNSGDEASPDWVDHLSVTPVASCDALGTTSSTPKAVFTQTVHHRGIDEMETAESKVRTQLPAGAYDVRVYSTAWDEDVNAEETEADAHACLVVSK
jgi:hypothetical protein